MATANQAADTVIVLDFETSGLSPSQGERAIEIGAVKIIDGEVVDSFQQLMNPGRRVNAFIENYTGITNAMLATAPSCETVMQDFSAFIDGYNLVAHNASFDSRFLDAEFERIRQKRNGEFACSMLVSRRIYPAAPNHKLGTLGQYKNLPNDGVFHRALADSQMTVKLWLAMINDIKNRYGFSTVPFHVMQKLSAVSRHGIDDFLSSEAKKFRAGAVQ